MVEISAPMTADMTAVLDMYRDHQRRRNLATSTIDRHRRLLRQVERATGRAIDDLTPTDLEGWVDQLRVGARTRYMYISAVGTFYRWLRETTGCANPAADLVRPRLPRLTPRPIDDDSLTLLLAGSDARMRAWLTLAAYSGFRCCEIAGLQREDVLDTATPPLLVVTGKGGHQRVIPLHPAVVVALRAYGLPRSRGPVFLLRGSQIKPGTVSSYITRYCHVMNVAATAHQLRHWFATRTYQASHDLRMVQSLLGHASPTTTAIYAAWDQGDAYGVVAGLGAR